MPRARWSSQPSSGRSQSRSSRFTLQFRWGGAPPAAKSLGNSRIGSPGLTPSGRLVDESTLFGVVRHSSPPTGVSKHRTPWEMAAAAISAFDDDIWDPLRREQRLDTVQG